MMLSDAEKGNNLMLTRLTSVATLFLAFPHFRAGCRIRVTWGQDENIETLQSEKQTNV